MAHLDIDWDAPDYDTDVIENARETLRAEYHVDLEGVDLDAISAGFAWYIRFSTDDITKLEEIADLLGEDRDDIED